MARVLHRYVAGGLILLTGILWAHEAHHPSHRQESADPEPIQGRALESYREKIGPIFRQKCFDCHSDQTRFPWYYKLPIAKQLIDHDIREGRKHLDMSQGFPFGGHHSPREQLQSIRKVIEKDSMPLPRYRWLHRNAGLTEPERQTILQWVRDSEDLLKK